MKELTISTLFPQVRQGVVLKEATYVGIDFGTSTSVVSIASYDAENHVVHSKSIPMKQLMPDGTIYTSDILPTVIAWLDEKMLIGEGAAQLKYTLQKGKNIWYSFKMELGEDVGPKYYDTELKREDYTIRNPQEATCIFFVFLKMQIENYCKEFGLSDNVQYAVSIPASFEANQRKDLLNALETSGMSISKQSLIDEPNAAFISYLVARSQEDAPVMLAPDYNPKVLVFDFGGGTCDISILEFGQNVHGFYSKNLSISKFTELGGDDIDRYLTYQYLLPRFLDANGKKAEQFKSKEREHIASALLKIAERLKILINKNLAVLTCDFIMPGVKDSAQTSVTLEESVIVFTRRGGVLKQNRFYLTNKELTEAMAVFMQVNGRVSKVQGQVYNSIFSPVQDALRKARLQKDDIDYVLFIGGSAQSPYIQEAVHAYFDEAEMLLPIDLRAHVSQGAAIHSLLLNGMNRCLIQPITSEPILLITKDERAEVIIPAGTQIPCDTILINNLETSREGQQEVELPICVGSPQKMLFNLKIKSTFPQGFPKHTPIDLTLEMNADKMLLAQAECMECMCGMTLDNPFANKELTTAERELLKLERAANVEAERNGGIMPKHSLETLRKAYERTRQYLKAAETYELQYELYPSSVSLNNIGVLYARAGRRDKALEFFLLALEENPNCEIINCNVAFKMKYHNHEAYHHHLYRALEINPAYVPALIEAAEIERGKGQEVKGLEKLRQACEIMKREWKTDPCWDDHERLIFVARQLGEETLVKEVQQSKEHLIDSSSKPNEEYFQTENLSQISNNLSKL